MILTDREIAAVARAAGFTGDDLTVAVAVCLAESRGNPEAVSGTADYGLWQIHATTWPVLMTPDVMAAGTWKDPALNASFAYRIWKSKGWKMWSTYNHGTYLSFMDRAHAAVGGTMIDTAALLRRADAWDRAHPPAGIGPVIRAVLKVIPTGANLWVQVAAQFTGKEEALDVIPESAWDEMRLPYSQASRLSFGRSMDCSSFWYGMFKVFFNIDIGYYTEAQYLKLHTKEIPWSQRQPTDHILFKFSDRNPHATHAANYMGSETIAHTTSPVNPFRFQSDTYGASSRVGVYRVLTDAQRQSLIVDSVPSQPGGDDMFVPGDTRTAQVKQIQTCLVALGYDLGTFGDNGDGIDGDYGTKTTDGVSDFQVEYKVKANPTGVCDEYTLAQLAYECALKMGDKEALEACEANLGASEAKLGACEAKLSQIATIAGS